MQVMQLQPGPVVRLPGRRVLELLVVVVLGLVVLSIAAPAYRAQQRHGWNAAAASDLRNLEVAEAGHALDHGVYASSPADLLGEWQATEGVTVALVGDASWYQATARGGDGDTYCVSSSSGRVVTAEQC